MVDLGTFVGDPPEHIDPALNTTLDAYQVVNAVYDGLTDIDASDPDNPKIVPQVAETVEPNEDATQWVFTIRDGLTFADGEEILPSTFVRSWSAPAIPSSPATTRTSSTSSRVAPRSSTAPPRRWPASRPTTTR